MTSELVLVTGSGGKTGRAVAAALDARGFKLRLFRKPKKGEGEAQARGELIYGDLTSYEDLKKACVEVEAVYHIGPNMHPAEQQIGMNAIRAASTAGVSHFVYHSVLHPQIEEMPHHWRKLRVEAELIGSPLQFTILQPAAYYQNVRHQWEDILASGEYKVPYRLGTKLSQVDLMDVAEVAGRVMLNPSHYSATYPLVGEEGLSQLDVATRMSQASPIPIKAVRLDRQKWAQGAMAAGMDSGRVQTFLDMFEYYEDKNFLGNSQVLRMLLGRAPSSLLEYFKTLQPRDSSV